MLLLLDRVSYDDIQQASRVYGEYRGHHGIILPNIVNLLSLLLLLLSMLLLLMLSRRLCHDQIIGRFPRPCHFHEYEGVDLSK